MKQHVPTSALMRDLLIGAPADQVSLGWLLQSLEERSFGLLMLILGLIALVPGASTLIGVLLAVPAVQMILGRSAPTFPHFIARRRIPTPRLARVLARIDPVLRRLERVIRPRWPTPIQATKRVVGFVTLLLGALLLVPVPFAHVFPALAIMLLSLAYLEEDGIALCVALAAALLALVIAGALVWGAIKGIDFLDPKAEAAAWRQSALPPLEHDWIGLDSDAHIDRTALPDATRLRYASAALR